MPRHALITLACAVTATCSAGPDTHAAFVPGQACEHIFTDTGVPVMEGDTARDGEHIPLCRRGYAAYLNTVTKNPDWVAEEITARTIKGQAERNDNFMEDAEAPPPASATLDDYRKSGFDRGHQAPAADFKNSQKRMDESFFLTNMAPQIGQCFNRGIWAQLEADVRDLASTRKRVIVFTGPRLRG